MNLSIPYCTLKTKWRVIVGVDTMKNPDYIVWSYSMGLIADTGTGGRSLGDVKKTKLTHQPKTEKISEFKGKTKVLNN